jgi:3',5'-cyclic AMP phosphodiesterase CpdA
MATFVLAHLSDPHLGPLPKARLAELAGKRATGLLNWHRKRGAIHRPDVLARIVDDLRAQAPDHIAVTGDLVNLALPDEYPPARAWLESLGSPDDVTFVPGNHDAYVRSSVRHPQTHWGAFMRGDGGSDGVAREFPFLRQRGAVALVGVSSAVPSAPLLAVGRVGAGQLEPLGRILDDCRKRGLFRVVLIHHPPRSSRKHYLKRLIDAPLLRDTLARHGAELVIHGHNHRRQMVELEGPAGRIPAIGVPSASEALPGEHDPAGYNLYRIGGEPGAWQCEAISRGLADGGAVVEVERTNLSWD